jgi:hypothetical protein
MSLAYDQFVESRRSSMAAERGNRAGPRLSGILERDRSAPPNHHQAEVESDGPPDGESTATTKGRGAVVRKSKLGPGRTIHLQDDLFERILVHAHRRGKNISEYVAGILERQVPDLVPSQSRPPREPRPEVEGDVEAERSVAGGAGE